MQTVDHYRGDDQYSAQEEAEAQRFTKQSHAQQCGKDRHQWIEHGAGAGGESGKGEIPKELRYSGPEDSRV